MSRSWYAAILAVTFAFGCGEAAFDPAAALAKSKVGMVDAVKTATQTVPDGFALEVELGLEEDKPSFDVEVTNAEGTWSIRVDAQSGAVTSSQALEPNDSEARVLAAIRTIDQRKRTTLLQALASVLAKIKDARPIEVDVDFHDRTKPVFEIEVLGNGERRVEIVEVEP
jgi:hypothetical protein